MGTIIDYPYAFKSKHHSIEGSFCDFLMFAVTHAKRALKQKNIRDDFSLQWRTTPKLSRKLQLTKLEQSSCMQVTFDGSE